MIEQSVVLVPRVPSIAGIVIAVLAILLLVLAAYLIHRRRKQDDQASSVSSDEEAGLELDDDIDSATRDDVSTKEGFGDTNDLRPVDPVKECCQ